MKLFLVIFSCLVLVLGQDVELEESVWYGINEQIATALENLKKQMPCGIPSQGIPPLAPYKRTYLEVKYEHKLFTLLGNFFDLRVDGLNDFRTEEVAFSVLSMKGLYDINFHKIIATGDYILNFFPFNLLRIKGKGKLDFRLIDLRIQGNFKLGLKGKGLAITNFDTTIILGDCQSNIDGLTGGKITGTLANKAIESFVKLFIKTQSEYISKSVHDIIVPMVNAKLETMSIKDILAIISSSQKPPTCVPPPENDFINFFQLFN